LAQPDYARLHDASIAPIIREFAMAAVGDVRTVLLTECIAAFTGFTGGIAGTTDGITITIKLAESAKTRHRAHRHRLMQIPAKPL